jgi:hypothetical protein
LKRRQWVEGKTRSWKGRQRDEGKIRRSREERPSQENESVRPHDLEFIHQTSQNQA